MYICTLPLESPSHLLPIPTPLGFYRVPVWIPWVIQQIPIGCLLIYVSVYASMLLSPFISPSLSSAPPLSISLFSMSVSPFLLCEQIHQYHPSSSHYIFYICINIQYLIFSFWLTSLCIIDSSFIHLIRTGSMHSFLWLSSIPLYICTTASLSFHLSMDI